MLVGVGWPVYGMVEFGLAWEDGWDLECRRKWKVRVTWVAVPGIKSSRSTGHSSESGTCALETSPSLMSQGPWRTHSLPLRAQNAEAQNAEPRMLLSPFTAVGRALPWGTCAWGSVGRGTWDLSPAVKWKLPRTAGEGSGAVLTRASRACGYLVAVGLGRNFIPQPSARQGPLSVAWTCPGGCDCMCTRKMFHAFLRALKR